MKKIILTAILFTFLFGGIQTGNAATVKYSYDLEVNCGDCSGGGLEVAYIEGIIKGTVRKTFNFTRENGNTTNLNFDLNIDKSVNPIAEPTTGEWFFSGGYDDSPPSDGIFYNVLSSSKFQQYLNVATSIPLDNNNFEVTSKNPNVVSCTNKKCTALKAGTATIVVSFPEKDKTSSYPILGSIQGYGKITTQSSSGLDSDAVTQTYSLPSITYTITVPPEPNQPHAVSCSGATNVTATGARINWAYSDENNDKQTNYQIQISTTANFSNIIKSVTAPANTDVSAIRSAAVSGLSPDTTYYSRVRAFNDTNGWSSYSNCASSFKTSNEPVAGICSATVPEMCDSGTLVPQDDTTTQYKWGCAGISGGTSNLSCSLPIDDGASLSCSVNNPVVKNEDAVYTATSLSGGTYQWYGSDGLTLIAGANTNTYIERYTSDGLYTRIVKFTKDGNTQSASCSANVDSCSKPTDTNCKDGKRTVYYCKADGTVGQNEVDCGSSDDDPKVPNDPVCNPLKEVCDSCDPSVEDCSGERADAEYEFDPNIVPARETCPLILEAYNVKGCVLESRSSTSVINLGADLNGKISVGLVVNKRGVKTGTYTLTCTGTDDVDRTFETKSCVSTPEIREY